MVQEQGTCWETEEEENQSCVQQTKAQSQREEGQLKTKQGERRQKTRYPRSQHVIAMECSEVVSRELEDGLIVTD